MKKEDKKEIPSKTSDNSFGVSSVILGILSILFSAPPLTGIALGIIAFIFGTKQQNKSPNVWGRRGKILGIVGILLSVIFLIFFVWISNNPELQSQLFGQNLNAI